jgi:hypothetical protein
VRAGVDHPLAQRFAQWLRARCAAVAM